MQCELDILSQQLELDVKEKEGQLHSVKDETNRAQVRKDALAQMIRDHKALTAGTGETPERLIPYLRAGGFDQDADAVEKAIATCADVSSGKMADERLFVRSGLMWEWKNEHDVWAAYPARVNIMIEEAHKAKQNEVFFDHKLLQIRNGQSYSIQFDIMKQVNVDSKTERPIRRPECELDTVKQNLELVISDALGSVQRIQDRGDDVQARAVQRIVSQLEAAKKLQEMQQEFEEQRKKILDGQEVAEHLERKKQEAEAAAREAEAQKILVAQNVAQMEQLKSALSLPGTWEPGTTDSILEVQRDSDSEAVREEYMYIQQYFTRTMVELDVKVQRIDRNQNMVLLQQYISYRSRIADDNGGDHNEQWMWHGCNPDVVPKVTKTGFNTGYASMTFNKVFEKIFT